MFVIIPVLVCIFVFLFWCVCICFFVTCVFVDFCLFVFFLGLERGFALRFCGAEVVCLSGVSGRFGATGLGV